MPKFVKLKKLSNIRKYLDNTDYNIVVTNIQVGSEIQCTLSEFSPIPKISQKVTSLYCLGHYKNLEIYIEPEKIWDDISLIFVNNIKEYGNNC